MKIIFSKCLALGILLTFFSCGPTDPPPPSPQFPLANQYGHEVFWEWNELFKRLDCHSSGYRPCPAPRALGYLGLAAYESVVPGMPFHKSLAPHFAGLSIPEIESGVEYLWPVCVNESYAFMLKRLFPHMENSPDPVVAAAFAEIEVLRSNIRGQFAENSTKDILLRSEKFGADVSAAVYEWSKTDLPGHNAFLDPQPSGYTPIAGPGFWLPTLPDYDRATFPHWGQVRTFALPEHEKTCAPPLPYGSDFSSPYYAQMLEVYLTVNAIKNPDPSQSGWAYQQLWASEFWSDDHLHVTFSPATRWISIADQIIAEEEMDLAVCAEMYAKLGLTLNDAAVAVWHSKYKYNVERPITYIRGVLSATIPEASGWSTLMRNPLTGMEGMSPAYPAYPSAHAGFSGGAGKVLSSFLENTPGFGPSYLFTDQSHAFEIDFLGTPRVFTSIEDLTMECALSRFSIGVNTRNDCEKGRNLGVLCAQRVLELPWK